MSSSPYSGSELPDIANSDFQPNLSKRYALDQVFEQLTWIATFIGLLVLCLLLYDIISDGASRLSWQFISSFPSRRPATAGLLSALVGSIWLLCVTAVLAFPVGVGSGIFLEEFAPDNFFTQLIEINIGNLAAVPSIIYGLLGLQVFARLMRPITGGPSILTGGLTLALLILPIIIVATREALRAVPNSLRQGGFAVGATRWQVVRDLILPQAIPGVLTGTILALSRAIGETAPLITIGALTFIAFLPPLSLEGLQTDFTALPIQVYNWVSRPQPAFHTNAAAGIIVLMLVLLLMNTTAVLLRNKFQKGRM
ncbi:MAG: phosphate ABC transporter permease PstA [Acaryochloris sp. RU_4_1]|nr:phosphate ABC transporter permease PstA [Acaryochloris sp. SU_5_25]NJM67130.1 phosphate ABC transporter permease PstA [Acaryochloris sp. RU_4_1]NJN38965.1 phosphate ABC transporter permease PstA [Acaryochloridaceae cyanobacterium CSU_3_4]NJR56130.1 phosphate ABC transporter permease PstA [Acaryochloris sp. CRU_2_0]